METARLRLRRFAPPDFDDFAALIRDKMASPYAMYDEQFPTDDERLRGILAYFAGTDAFVAVEGKAEKRVIGFVALNPEGDGARNLGFCVHSACQGRGYAGEAAAAMVERARQTPGVRRLVSGAAEQNVPAVRLLTRLGFVCTDRREAAFARDADGNPIRFTACSFELNW